MFVLIDNHHAQLTYSLELLFGKRLGYKVVYPMGLEWYEKGYWNVYPHPATAESYLGLARADKTAHSKEFLMTGSGIEKPDPRLHYHWDSTKGIYERGVALETFKQLPVAFLVASMPVHAESYGELIQKYQPASKLIFQMGNNFQEFHFQSVKNVLNSTQRKIPFWIRSVSYNQEFDLGVFKYEPPRNNRLIVNLTHYMSNAEYFNAVKSFLPQHRMESYGAGNETGSIARTADVADKMKEADFIWHLKHEDGYGHVLHNAAALGRPVIISKNQYRKLRFGKFIEDGVTCIDVDGLSAEGLAKKIRHFGEPERLERMSKALYQRFRDLVDFDRDERNVRRFLAGLR